MTDRIRITAGIRRNRRLLSPPKNSIRPASDMIRQAVFNMLGDEINDVDFYDIFAGTGVVGIEALSRGARKAVFIELERNFVQLIRKNLELARLTSQAVVRTNDAFLWGKHFVPEPNKTIVFLGPPYPMCEGRDAKRVIALVSDVMAKLRDEDTLILQTPRTMDASLLPDIEHWVRNREYGKTRIGIWRKGGSPGDPIWIHREKSDESIVEQEVDGESDER